MITWEQHTRMGQFMAYVCELLDVDLDEAMCDDVEYEGGLLGLYPSGHNNGRAIRWTYEDEQGNKSTGVWTSPVQTKEWMNDA